MKLKTFIIQLIIAVFCVSAFAHQDRIFILNENTLEGLPDQYQPATFSYETRELKIENSSIIIPSDIWVLFGDTSKEKLMFTGSWYHHRRRPLIGKDKSLPPYMSIENSNYELLLNLDTLEIIEVSWNPQITAAQLEQWNSSIVWKDGRPKIKTKDRATVIELTLIEIAIPIILVIGLITFVIVKIIKKRKPQPVA